MTGATDEAELEQIAQKLDVSKLAPQIKCPFLVAAGEDDQLSDAHHTFDFLNSLTGAKSLIFYEGEDHGIHASRAGQLGGENRQHARLPRHQGSGRYLPRYG